MIPDINLLPNTGRDEEDSRTRYMLLGIIAILLLAIMSWLYFSARSDVVSLTTEEQALQAEYEAVQGELGERQVAEQGSVGESLAFIEQISYPATPLVDETQRLLPENTYLRSYSFSQAAVTFTVDFETLNAISSYIEDLEYSPYFLDVQLGAITNFELGASRQEQDATARFSEVPRYTAEVMLAIDRTYLATGGVE